MHPRKITTVDIYNTPQWYLCTVRLTLIGACKQVVQMYIRLQRNLVRSVVSILPEARDMEVKAYARSSNIPSAIGLVLSGEKLQFQC
jgi:hypothetical protein